MEKNGSGVVTADRYFVWDGMRIAEERSSPGGAPVKIYTPFGEVRSGVKYYYTKDHLGSVREVLNSSGNIVARYDYDPFGVPTQTAGTMKFDMLYTGHFYHWASGLYLAPFRAYNPQLGRWISRDPIGIAGGMNLYGYVGNNPLNHIDIDGLAPKSITYKTKGPDGKIQESSSADPVTEQMVQLAISQAEAIMQDPAFIQKCQSKYGKTKGVLWWQHMVPHVYGDWQNTHLSIWIPPAGNPSIYGQTVTNGGRIGISLYNANSPASIRDTIMFESGNNSQQLGNTNVPRLDRSEKIAQDFEMWSKE